MSRLALGSCVLVAIQIAILCVWSGYFRKPVTPKPRLPYFSLYLAKLNHKPKLK